MSLISYQLSESEKKVIAEKLRDLKAVERRSWNQCLRFLFNIDGRSLKIYGGRAKVVIPERYSKAVPSGDLGIFDPFPEAVSLAFKKRGSDGSHRYFAQYKSRLMGNRGHRIADWYESNREYLYDFMGLLDGDVAVICTDEQFLELLKEYNKWLDEEFYPNRGVE